MSKPELKISSNLAPNVIVGVWRGSTEVLVQAYSMGESISIDHRVRIGNITKMFIALVIKQLVGAKKIQLGDSVGKILQLDKLPPELTIEHLATMKSGLADYVTDSEFLTRCSLQPSQNWTPEELINIALKYPFHFSPGQKWMYCNTNYILLGRIIETVTGQSLSSNLEERIFKPLKMKSTYLSNEVELPAPSIPGFRQVGDILMKTDKCSPSMAWAAGGVVSTLPDLYRFAKQYSKGQLLSFERFKNSSCRYGFGIMNIMGFYGHNGSFPGYQSFLGYSPEKDVTMIILTNLGLTKDGKPPADVIAQEIIPQL